MTRVGMQVVGVDEVLRALRRLDDAVSSRTTLEAMEDAGEILVTAMKANAPSSVIAEGVKILNSDVELGGAVVLQVGLEGGPNPWFIGLFLERGTGPRETKGGRRTGSMPAQPWMRPAYLSARGAAADQFGKSIKAQLARVAPGV